MIYLIGGAPRCGKSILAGKASKKLKISTISTDGLRPLIVEYLPKKQLAKLMPFEGSGSKNMTASESLEAELQEARTMWPGLKRFIQQLIDMREDYIIEGVHLLPEFVSELRKSTYGKSIAAIYLVKEDTKKIVDGFHKNTNPFDWMQHCLDNTELLQSMAEMVSIKGGYMRKEANKRRLPVINTETVFTTKINTAVKEIAKKF